MKARLVATVVTAAVALAFTPSVATASVIGFLGTFYVINYTGQTAYGFEIKLEGLHSSDVSDVFASQLCCQSADADEVFNGTTHRS